MVAKEINSDRFLQAGEKEWRWKNQNQNQNNNNQYQYRNNHQNDRKKMAMTEEKPNGPCNLDRFLESTTPSVPARYISKNSGRIWNECETDMVPFFTLDDLWESFEEWSVYGAGVPVNLHGFKSMVQYYVPYLSAIQLYTESNSPHSECRQGGDSDGDSYHDSSSDMSSSSDIEQERLMINAQLMFDHLNLKDSDLPFQDGIFTNPPPTYEFFEKDPPHTREPLSDKICSLAVEFPALRTLRSCDLLPGSWFSVAWYPIYRIPIGNTLRDIEACFLTYHHLSLPIKGVESEFGPKINFKKEGPVMKLPTFGLANYKFRPNIWAPHRSEKQTAFSLLQSADKWLRALDVSHPDYQFFDSNSSCRK
ncbi:hypothetical protein LUZ60_009927 [Juncus effusus]|nr:hypothetical protein LUZ60_009927 [Juncus effusus]